MKRIGLMQAFVFGKAHQSLNIFVSSVYESDRTVAFIRWGLAAGPAERITGHLPRRAWGIDYDGFVESSTS